MDDLEFAMNAKSDFDDVKSGKKKLNKKMLKKYKKYIPDEVNAYIKNIPKEGIDIKIPENLKAEDLVKMAGDGSANNEQKK